MFGRDRRFANVLPHRRLARGLRRRLLGFLRPEADAKPTRLDDAEISQHRHLFIFGVCGRTSTTALMRILNSTGRICVWGEPGDFLVDDLVALIARLQAKNDEPKFKERKEAVPRAFAENDHTIGHALAFPDLTPAIERLIGALGSMFAPATDVDRFGFKEIKVRDASTLETLRQVFPRADFVFLFRDPREQWPSVKKMENWKEVATLELFLQEYARLAKIYLDFGGTFIETKSLYDKANVQRLVDQLELGAFEDSLIGDGVFAMRNKAPLSADESAAIEASPAAALYTRLLERS